MRKVYIALSGSVSVVCRYVRAETRIESCMTSEAIDEKRTVRGYGTSSKGRRAYMIRTRKDRSGSGLSEVNDYSE